MKIRAAMLTGLVLVGSSFTLWAADGTALQSLLGEEVIGSRQIMAELQKNLAARIPKMPRVTTKTEWEREAERLRTGVLREAVFRGEAAKWGKLPTRAVWLETIEGGLGYRIKKLRFEAVPGLWIPALLYEPLSLSGKVPVHLAVNGHDGEGKAVGYKQERCINLAKRGMIVLNVEWLGMGQLNSPGYTHGRMNQLDLCGTSGLAPFYLSMKRSLDILLAHPQADPKRVAVHGLSGGGWQTITISSLDTRVTLSNPVAGYSSLLTRLQHFKDLGDSEQMPCDLATIADYTHLTALLPPRALLLTYNSKDNCCFESGYALPPLVAAAQPIFELYGRKEALRTHVNDDPGDHNFGKDNRQALYRMIGRFFFPGSKEFSPVEIDCRKEIKSRPQLNVELPAGNADFNTLALALSKNLPRGVPSPGTGEAREKWQTTRRTRLCDLIKAQDWKIKAGKTQVREKGNTRATHRPLMAGDQWSVPVLELVRGQPQETVILIHDGGKKATAAQAERLLSSGKRVLAVDPLMMGEARVEPQVLFSNLVACTGLRPLGLQASQLMAVARWAKRQFPGPVTVSAIGPRCCLAAMSAAALETQAIAGLELQGSLGSLKEIIEQNRSVDDMPEAFCFGLLEALDLKDLAGLVAPRPVRFVEPSERVRKEMAIRGK